MTTSKRIFFISIFALFAFIGTSMSYAQASCTYTGSNPAGYRCSPRYEVQQTSYQTPHYTSTANIEAYIQQLLTLLQELRALQNNSQYVYTYTPPQNSQDNAAVNITTRKATDIEKYSVTLRAEIDFNNEDEATVYFQFGKYSNNLNKETTHQVLDEDDDNETFTHKITNLRKETTYYYRAVAEDESGRRDYGKILSFKTNRTNTSSRNDDEPDVDTDNATNITRSSAKLRGDIDMNDFDNGIVFFVYGEDEDQIEDIENDYDQYRDIDQDGDNLQKTRVDSDLDGSGYFTTTVHNLDRNTDMFFAICVEFENEDYDDELKCGRIENFETDN